MRGDKSQWADRRLPGIHTTPFAIVHVRWFLILLVAAACLFPPTAQLRAQNLDDYLLTIETMDCEGRHGLGVIKITQLKRINPMTCSNGRELARVHLNSSEGMADTFTISPESVRQIQQDLRLWQEARRRQMLNTDTVNIHER